MYKCTLQSNSAQPSFLKQPTLVLDGTIACHASGLSQVLYCPKNYLYLHPLKCKYMIISRKKAPTLWESPLQLLGSDLERVDCYKYLGILLTCDLSWSSHISNICAKAHHVLDLLYRRFYGSSTQSSLKKLYLFLVRPHLEYACQVWDPYLLKDKKAIENVQKFALKVVTSRWDSSYDEQLELVELKSLEERRVELKLGLIVI